MVGTGPGPCDRPVGEFPGGRGCLPSYWAHPPFAVPRAGTARIPMNQPWAIVSGADRTAAQSGPEGDDRDEDDPARETGFPRKRTVKGGRMSPPLKTVAATAALLLLGFGLGACSSNSSIGR